MFLWELFMVVFFKRGFGMGGRRARFVVVNAQVGDGSFDFKLVAWAGQMERAGCFNDGSPLAEQVDNVFAAIDSELVGVRDGFGYLPSRVGTF